MRATLRIWQDDHALIDYKATLELLNAPTLTTRHPSQRHSQGGTLGIVDKRLSIG